VPFLCALNQPSPISARITGSIKSLTECDKSRE
jgi:hypothetical protein